VAVLAVIAEAEQIEASDEETAEALAHTGARADHAGEAARPPARERSRRDGAQPAPCDRPGPHWAARA